MDQVAMLGQKGFHAMTRFFFFFLGLGFFAATAWSQLPAKHVNVIELDNQIISPVTAQYIENGIRQSEEDGAACLIIQLDTPGGLLESTRAIVKRMMNAKVPIVVYIAPSGSRAGSAGVFITLAAHIAAMASSTNIGAAHPVLAGGENTFKRILRQVKENQQPGNATPAPKGEQGEETDVLSEKIINDTVAWITGIARVRGRNQEWARRAVTESVSVGDTEAAKEHIVDLSATSLPGLLIAINGWRVHLQEQTRTLETAGAQVVIIPMSFRQHFLAAIVHPDVAYILMMLGILGLIFEFTHPGAFFPGIGGLICILLALYAFQTLSVNIAAMMLIGLGLLLLVAEIKVNSHGVLALSGIVALTLGSLMLFDSTQSTLQVSLGIIVSMVLTLSAITLLLVQRAAHSLAMPVATGGQGLMGAIGQALTDLAPEGLVRVHGEIWSAVATAPIQKDQPVQVCRLEGLRLTVEPAPRKNSC